MGRILAIDYGRKRVGLAVTDPLQIIANKLTTVRAHDIFDFLADYFSKENRFVDNNNIPANSKNNDLVRISMFICLF